MFRAGETDHMHLLVGAPGSETIGVYSVDVAYHRRNKTLIIRTERPGESAYYMGINALLGKNRFTNTLGPD